MIQFHLVHEGDLHEYILPVCQKWYDFRYMCNQILNTQKALMHIFIYLSEV